MKFDIKNVIFGGCYFKEQSSERLISIGDIVLFKENNKGTSCCKQNNKDDYFDYHGIENALCGKTEFTPKRILVLSFK